MCTVVLGTLEVAALNGQSTVGHGYDGDAAVVLTVNDGQATCGSAVTNDEGVAAGAVAAVHGTVLHGYVRQNADDGSGYDVLGTVDRVAVEINGHILIHDQGSCASHVTNQGDGVVRCRCCKCIGQRGVLGIADLSNIALLSVSITGVPSAVAQSELSILELVVHDEFKAVDGVVVSDDGVAVCGVTQDTEHSTSDAGGIQGHVLDVAILDGSCALEAADQSGACVLAGDLGVDDVHVIQSEVGGEAGNHTVEVVRFGSGTVVHVSVYEGQVLDDSALTETAEEAHAAVVVAGQSHVADGMVLTVEGTGEGVGITVTDAGEAGVGQIQISGQKDNGIGVCGNLNTLILGITGHGGSECQQILHGADGHGDLLDRVVLAFSVCLVVVVYEVGTDTLGSVVSGVELVEGTALHNDLGSAVVVSGVDAVEGELVCTIVLGGLEVAALNGQRALGDGYGSGAAVVLTVNDGQATCGSAVANDEGVAAGAVAAVHGTVLHGHVGQDAEHGAGVHGILSGDGVTAQIDGQGEVNDHGGVDSPVTQNLKNHLVVACIEGLTVCDHGCEIVALDVRNGGGSAGHGIDDVKLEDHVGLNGEGIVAVVNRLVALSHEVGTCALSSVVRGIEAVELTALHNNGSGAVLVVGIDAVEQVGCTVLALSGLELAALDGQRALGHGSDGGRTGVAAALDGQVACGGTVGGTQHEDVIAIGDGATLNGHICAVLNTECGIYAVAVHGQTGQIQSGILGDDHGSVENDGLNVAGLGSSQSVSEVGVVNFTHRGNVGVLVNKLATCVHITNEGILCSGAVLVGATVCVACKAADGSSAALDAGHGALRLTICEGDVLISVFRVRAGTNEATSCSDLGDDVNISDTTGHLVVALADVIAPAVITEETARKVGSRGYAGNINFTLDTTVFCIGPGTRVANKAAHIHLAACGNIQATDGAVVESGVLPDTLCLTNQAAYSSNTISIINDYREVLNVEIFKDVCAFSLSSVFLNESSNTSDQRRTLFCVNSKVFNGTVIHFHVRVNGTMTEQACHKGTRICGSNFDILNGNIINIRLINATGKCTKTVGSHGCSNFFQC